MNSAPQATSSPMYDEAIGPKACFDDLDHKAVDAQLLQLLHPPKYSWWRQWLKIGPKPDRNVKYVGANVYQPLVEVLKPHAFGKERVPSLRSILTREAMRWCKLHHVQNEVIPGSVAAAMVPDDIEMHALRYEKEAANQYRARWLSKNLA